MDYVRVSDPCGGPGAGVRFGDRSPTDFFRAWYPMVQSRAPDGDLRGSPGAKVRGHGGRRVMSPCDQGWFTSSYSGNAGQCVSVRFVDGSAQVRDDKVPDGPVLVF